MHIINHDTITDFRGSKISIGIALLSISFYVLFKLTLHPISKINFEAIFILIFLGGLFFRTWQIKHDLAFRLIFLAVLLPLFFFLVNYYQDTVIAKEYFNFEKLVKLTLFCSIGFWLGGILKNIYCFLLLIYFGLLISLFNVDPIAAFKGIYSGQRIDFGIQNAQHTAMFFGLAIIGFISFYRAFLLSHKRKLHRFLLISFFALSLFIVISVFIGTKTRASLLAMDCIYLVSVIHFYLFRKNNNITRHIKYLFGTYAVISFFILSLFTVNTFHSRGTEQLVTKTLIEKNFDKIPMSSLGIRINTWIEAGKWIKEKPVHGWGGDVRTHVIEKSNFSAHIKKHFGHFHNSYIEFTLAYGFVGLLFVLFIYSWVNRKVYLLKKQTSKFHGVWLFTLYGSLYMLIINIFESYLFFRTGVYATAILLAPAYSLYLSDLYSKLNIPTKP